MARLRNGFDRTRRGHENRAVDAALELAVLLALRVRGRADVAHVALAIGRGEVDAGTALADVETRGLAERTSNGAFALTASGREVLARALAAESLDRAALALQYERFMVVDRELKRAVTTWQLAEPANQAAAVAGVMAAAAAAGAIATALAALAARYGSYAGRIAVAAGAIATGDRRYVASPRVDSLHQAWFELHEDLLVTLGRSRDA